MATSMTMTMTMTTVCSDQDQIPSTTYPQSRQESVDMTSVDGIKAKPIFSEAVPL